MSYYDHAVLMHLKLEPWDHNEYGVRQRHRVVRSKRMSLIHGGGVKAMLIFGAVLLVLGMTGLGV